ncbi:hypothetical protein R4J09_15295, partial [Brachyspira intermedia]
MSKELDELLWWIPFRKIREKIRNIYYDMNNKINTLNDKINYLEWNNHLLLEDKEFKDRFIRYVMCTQMDHRMKRWLMERIHWLGYFINFD